MRTLLVATSNPGKFRDFLAAARASAVEIRPLTDFSSLPPVREDGPTFAANACKKAQAYSRQVPGEIVIAEDSGLEVDALGGAPGVHSARYAAEEPRSAETNAADDLNNAKLLREIRAVPRDQRAARFVSAIAAARDGEVLGLFEGRAEGIILDRPRGSNGFGYDPLFYLPKMKKTFAELSAEEKAKYSHRGAAFKKLLAWCLEI